MSKPILRLLRLALGYKWWMLLSVLLGFLTIGSNIGLFMTSAYIIAKAALHPSIAELQVGIVGVRFFGISRGIFRYLERIVSHDVTFRLLAKFRVWFYRAIEPLAPANLTRFKSGDLLNRAINDIQSLEKVYVRMISPPLVAVFITILTWVLLGTFDPVFSVVTFGFLFFAGVGVPLITRKMTRGIGKRLTEIHSELNVLTVDGLQGMAELLVFGQSEEHLRKFRRLNRKYIRLQRLMTLVDGLHESFIGLLMNMNVLALLLLAIPKIHAGTMEGVYLAVLIMGIMAAFEAVLPLPAALQYREQNAASAERLFEIIDSPPAISLPDKPRKPSGGFELAFKNLSFFYPANKRLVLRDISFGIEEGKKVAVVGTSGAGKTTLVNLLLRFWDFETGKILFGKHDIRWYDPEELRELMSVVSQNTYLFNQTIRENLRFAKPNASEAEILQAVQNARLHDFVKSLPLGLDAWVGEHGLQLSGGERQRLAIARAFLKSAPLLILDEPTANLDVFTEQKILQTIWQLSENRTTLLITHRLVQLENVDEIFVLRNGEIVERGTHRQLVLKKGLYFRMWDQQRQVLVIEQAGAAGNPLSDRNYHRSANR